MGLMRNLGKMVGHIRNAVVKPVPKSPPPHTDHTPPPPHPPHAHAVPACVVAQRVQEATVQTPEGPVLLRRTTTDEVIVSPMSPASPQPPPH